MSFLNYDSAFMQGLRRIYDYVVLGLLWALMSLPIFTFGAATVAALYTADSAIENHGGHITTIFFKRFRAEFFQASLLWLFAIVLIAMLIFDVYLLWSSAVSVGLRLLCLAVMYVMFCWIHLWFGYLYKFTDKTTKLMYNTFCMFFQNFFLSVLLGIITFVAVVLYVVSLLGMLPLLMLVPGIYLMAQSNVFRKITSQYTN